MDLLGGDERNAAVKSSRTRRRTVVAALATLTVATLTGGVGVAQAAQSTSASPHVAGRVLTVGTWHGIKGKYKTIQAAVDAAKPGDWVVIAPGDYKERGDYRHPAPQGPGWPGAGVQITTPNIHLLGLSRSGVIVDGTKSGPACSSAKKDQDYGPSGVGRNGILVYKASGVTISNLTVCNFLSGKGDGAGNQIWWNAGYTTGQPAPMAYTGSYLNATTQYFSPKDGHQATYGIFASDSTGPGLIKYTYANNMNDSSYYIGACPDCNAVLDHAHGQNSVLGYSGTNSGGHLVISNSEFDHNSTGLDTNTQGIGDPPAPQNGACPSGAAPGDITSAPNGNCWMLINNYIHDNNNRNVPGNTLAMVGVGISLSGAHNDTLKHNRFVNNKAWAVAIVPFVDNAKQNECTGGLWGNSTVSTLLGASCLFEGTGIHVTGNTFVNNGGFGNPTNGDIFNLSGLFDNHGLANCFDNNIDSKGLTTEPSGLQTTNAMCGQPLQLITDGMGLQRAFHVLCNLQQAATDSTYCNGDVYPHPSKIVIIKIPKQQSMPNPCKGLPSRPAFCKYAK